MELVKIERDSVDPDTKDVYVLTQDGKVPIGAVSQGTASLMCWVGVLIQRLAEVHGTGTPVREQKALVLIDEIDTHMHPHWQRSLADRLSELFPNVQFIATTHSPLVVAGLPPECIVVLRRVEDKVECRHLSADGEHLNVL